MICDLIGDIGRFGEGFFKSVTNNPTAVGVCTMYNCNSTLGAVLPTNEVSCNAPGVGGKSSSVERY